MHFSLEMGEVVIHSIPTENFSPKNWLAVVTGGNRGIGLEICKQLASNGVRVILTARDEKKGMDAVEKLKAFEISDVLFHQLDVTDASSIASFADFVRIEFGKLDILVNNAGASGVTIDPKVLKASEDAKHEEVGGLPKWYLENIRQTYELAEQCLKTNYKGAKDVTEALLPLLQASSSGRIVNISSVFAQTRNISCGKVREAISDVNGLSEEKLDELSRLYLEEFKEGLRNNENYVPTSISSYILSKALVNAYTILLAKKYPTLVINCICPGFVKTDMNYHIGLLPVEEGANGPVALALMHDSCPTGQFFEQTNVSTF